MNEEIYNSRAEKNKPKITILVAEDEIANYKYLKMILIEKNYNVIHANNGQEAVNLIKEDRSIELILMDITMPIMDGITASKLIREINPSIPIIMQSGNIDKNVQKQAREVGCNAFVIKPFSKLELFEIIKKLVRDIGSNK